MKFKKLRSLCLSLTALALAACGSGAESTSTVQSETLATTNRNTDGLSNVSTETQETPIQELTAKEFSDLTPDRQGEIVQAILLSITKHYNKADNTRYKAQCLIALFNTQDENGHSKLVSLIDDELALAAVDTEEHLVKDVMHGVAEHNCSKAN